MTIECSCDDSSSLCFSHRQTLSPRADTADMEFRPEDTQEDWDTKQRLLAIYNARLDERERRRDYIKAQGLLNTRMLQVLIKYLSCAVMNNAQS